MFHICLTKLKMHEHKNLSVGSIIGYNSASLPFLFGNIKGTTRLVHSNVTSAEARERKAYIPFVCSYLRSAQQLWLRAEKEGPTIRM